MIKTLFFALFLSVSAAAGDDFEVTHAVIDYENQPSNHLEFDQGMTLIIHVIKDTDAQKKFD